MGASSQVCLKSYPNSLFIFQFFRFLFSFHCFIVKKKISLDKIRSDLLPLKFGFYNTNSEKVLTPSIYNHCTIIQLLNFLKSITPLFHFSNYVYIYFISPRLGCVIVNNIMQNVVYFYSFCLSNLFLYMHVSKKRKKT